MKSQLEWNRMMGQQLYSPCKVGDDSWEKVHAAQKKFNESEFWHDAGALDELKNALGKRLRIWCLRRLFILIMEIGFFSASISMPIPDLQFWTRIM